MTSCHKNRPLVSICRQYIRSTHTHYLQELTSRNMGLLEKLIVVHTNWNFLCHGPKRLASCSQEPRDIQGRLECSVCTCLTQLYLMVDIYIYIYRVYYIKMNYMFLPLTMAIFRLRLKNLVSSYTRLMLAVYSGEVRSEVGTRSRMCCVGWVVWVHGVLLLYFMSS